MTAVRTSSPTRRRAPARRQAPRAARSGASSRTAVRSLPQEEAGPRLRLLPRRRVSLRAVMAVAFVVTFSVVAGGVVIQAQRVQAQHRFDEVRKELVEAGDEHRVLRAEVAFAESPDRIMEAARGMGMVEPAAVLPLAAVGGADEATTEQGAPQR